MTVPDFDTPTAPVEPILFRLLGREWECHPEPTPNALVAAQVGGAMAAYADDFPEAATSIIADIALRFISWSVVDTDAWAQALAGARIPAETAVEVMGWLSTKYRPPTAPQPAPGRPRTTLDQLERITTAAGLGPVIAKD